MIDTLESQVREICANMKMEANQRNEMMRAKEYELSNDSQGKGIIKLK